MKKIIYLTLIMALLLVVNVCATTVTRSVSSTANKNTDVTVTLDVNVGTATYYLIDEQFPSDISVKSVSGGGDYTTTSGHIFWVVLQDAQDTSYTYTINTGNTDRTIQFIGTYGAEDSDEADILGDNQIIVGEGNGEIIPPGDMNWLWIVGIVGIVLYFVFKKK